MFGAAGGQLVHAQRSKGTGTVKTGSIGVAGLPEQSAPWHGRGSSAGTSGTGCLGNSK